MDSKTVTTIMIVFVCVLLFPVFIGIVGGIFGLIGGMIGGIFGAIGWLIGTIFGVIGSIFGAIFGIFGWMFDGHHFWHWPGGWFNRDLLGILVVVLIVVLISRSRAQHGSRGK